MFNTATDTFNYQGDDYIRLTNKGTSIAMRGVLSKVYHTVFAGASFKSGITNCIEAAQFFAGKGVTESTEADKRHGGFSAAIRIKADGPLQKDLSLLSRLPKNNCDKQVTVNLFQIAAVDMPKYSPALNFRYRDTVYIAEIN